MVHVVRCDHTERAGTERLFTGPLVSGANANPPRRSPDGCSTKARGALLRPALAELRPALPQVNCRADISLTALQKIRFLARNITTRPISVNPFEALIKGNRDAATKTIVTHLTRENNDAEMVRRLSTA
jgi:hypothetical protein